MDTIKDNLTITITEAKVMLRLNDRPVSGLAQVATSSDTTIVLDDVGTLRITDKIQILTEYVDITGIDAASNTLTINPALAHTYPVGTIVYENPDNRFLETLINAAKSAADTYLEATLDDLGGVIPEDIKVWCLRNVARYFEARPSGVKKISEGDIDRIILNDEEWYHTIHRYRQLEV